MHVEEICLGVIEIKSANMENNQREQIMNINDEGVVQSVVSKSVVIEQQGKVEEQPNPTPRSETIGYKAEERNGDEKNRDQNSPDVKKGEDYEENGAVQHNETQNHGENVQQPSTTKFHLAGVVHENDQADATNSDQGGQPKTEESSEQINAAVIESSHRSENRNVWDSKFEQRQVGDDEQRSGPPMTEKEQPTASAVENEGNKQSSIRIERQEAPSANRDEAVVTQRDETQNDNPPRSLERLKDITPVGSPQQAKFTLPNSIISRVKSENPSSSSDGHSRSSSPHNLPEKLAALDRSALSGNRTIPSIPALRGLTGVSSSTTSTLPALTAPLASINASTTEAATVSSNSSTSPPSFELHGAKQRPDIASLASSNAPSSKQSPSGASVTSKDSSRQTETNQDENESTERSSGSERASEKPSLIGKSLMRNFPGHGRFAGQVMSFNEQTQTYTVMYSDGDTEQFTEDEVCKLLSNQGPAGDQPIGQAMPSSHPGSRVMPRGQLGMSHLEHKMHPSEAHGYGASHGPEGPSIELFDSYLLPLLINQGWTVEQGSRASPSDRFFFPPGVTRQNGKVRIDYFDSVKQVVNHIRQYPELSALPHNMPSNDEWARRSAMMRSQGMGGMPRGYGGMPPQGQGQHPMMPGGGMSAAAAAAYYGQHGMDPNMRKRPLSQPEEMDRRSKPKHEGGSDTEGELERQRAAQGSGMRGMQLPYMRQMGMMSQQQQQQQQMHGYMVQQSSPYSGMRSSGSRYYGGQMGAPQGMPKDDRLGVRKLAPNEGDFAAMQEAAKHANAEDGRADTPSSKNSPCSSDIDDKKGNRNRRPKGVGPGVVGVGVGVKGAPIKKDPMDESPISRGGAEGPWPPQGGHPSYPHGYGQAMSMAEYENAQRHAAAARGGNPEHPASRMPARGGMEHPAYRQAPQKGPYPGEQYDKQYRGYPSTQEAHYTPSNRPPREHVNSPSAMPGFQHPRGGEYHSLPPRATEMSSQEIASYMTSRGYTADDMAAMAARGYSPAEIAGMVMQREREMSAVSSQVPVSSNSSSSLNTPTQSADDARGPRVTSAPSSAGTPGSRIPGHAIRDGEGGSRMFSMSDISGSGSSSGRHYPGISTSVTSAQDKRPERPMSEGRPGYDMNNMMSAAQYEDAMARGGRAPPGWASSQGPAMPAKEMPSGRDMTGRPTLPEGWRSGMESRSGLEARPRMDIRPGLEGRPVMDSRGVRAGPPETGGPPSNTARDTPGMYRGGNREVAEMPRYPPYEQFSQRDPREQRDPRDHPMSIQQQQAYFEQRRAAAAQGPGLSQGHPAYFSQYGQQQQYEYGDQPPPRTAYEQGQRAEHYSSYGRIM